jgi:phosphoribosylaminoimidazole carboxylase PurE protein
MIKKEQILILTGSRSDLPEIEKATRILNGFGVPYRVQVASAHRTPDEVVRIVRQSTEESVKVVIAAAGLANHLAGAAASRTVCPVIGVPLARPPLQGLDSLLSTVQMPPGVPVATVGIGALENAAFLALQILALSDPALRKKLVHRRLEMRSGLLKGK